ncbi:MAG: DUF4398 domain-containing protein [Gallionellaceae bacterium]|nr:DUF4398 domain-containing protein [Gallionellaceae bacterium]
MKKVSEYEWYGRMGLLTGVVLLSVSCASNKPPVPTEQMAVSRAAIAEAVSAGATEFAPVELGAAQDKLAAADKAVAAEDNGSAKWLAEQAQLDAQLAAKKARTAKAQKAAEALQESNQVLREEISRSAK